MVGYATKWPVLCVLWAKRRTYMTGSASEILWPLLHVFIHVWYSGLMFYIYPSLSYISCVSVSYLYTSSVCLIRLKVFQSNRITRVECALDSVSLSRSRVSRSISLMGSALPTETRVKDFCRVSNHDDNATSYNGDHHHVKVISRSYLQTYCQRVNFYYFYCSCACSLIHSI